MAATYRNSSPITGYTGHLPGAKFHVGSNMPRPHLSITPFGDVIPNRTPLTHRDAGGGVEGIHHEESIAYGFDNEGNPVPRGGGIREPQPETRRSGGQLNLSNNSAVGPVFQIPVQFIHTNDPAAASLRIPVHPQMLQNDGEAETRSRMNGSRSVHDLAAHTDRLSVHEDDERRIERKEGRASRASNGSKSKRRSKSVPRKKREDRPDWRDGGALNGASHGYYTEGQALHNLRRHNERMGLPPYTAAANSRGGGGEFTDEGGDDADDEHPIEHATTAANNRQSGTSAARLLEGRTPAPGYSGHLIEMHRLEIGKNFTDAAKESRKLQQTYRESLNGSFISARSHSPQKNTVTARSRRSQQ